MHFPSPTSTLQSPYIENYYYGYYRSGLPGVC